MPNSRPPSRNRRSKSQEGPADGKAPAQGQPPAQAQSAKPKWQQQARDGHTSDSAPEEKEKEATLTRKVIGLLFQGLWISFFARIRAAV